MFTQKSYCRVVGEIRFMGVKLSVYKHVETQRDDIVFITKDLSGFLFKQQQVFAAISHRKQSYDNIIAKEETITIKEGPKQFCGVNVKNAITYITEKGVLLLLEALKLNNEAKILGEQLQVIEAQNGVLQPVGITIQDNGEELTLYGSTCNPLFNFSEAVFFFDGINKRTDMGKYMFESYVKKNGKIFVDYFLTLSMLIDFVSKKDIDQEKINKVLEVLSKLKHKNIERGE